MQSSTSSDGAVRTVQRWSLTRRLTHDEDLAAHLTESLWRGEADRLLASSDLLQVKDRCTVARHEGAEGPVLIKRHTWGGAWRTIRMAWRQSSARRCARLGWYLAERGFPTPRPRAFLEECIGPAHYRSYLVTDYIEGADLYRFVRLGWPTAAEVRHVARQVVRILAGIAALDISHNDTKPQNFIVDENLRVWLIDFEKSRVGGKGQRQRQIAEVKDFLHVGRWRQRAAARQIFLDEFLRKHRGESLDERMADSVDEVRADRPALQAA